MKRSKKSIVSAVLTAAIGMSSLAAYAADDTDARLAAFPGAEGGGMYATGARASQEREVYHVTNLKDSGKGSFRDAVSGSDRIIVFDVAGNIELVNALSIVGNNLTILGQTAPGDGICIKDNTVGVYGDNVIIRYMRFRMGDNNTVEDDSIGGRGINNVILDHCSISWCTDECASFYDNTNFTMQWCIISESLKESVHSKGSHGYGGIWGGKNASFHHNLIADHDSRNPRIATAGIDAAYDDVTKQVDLTDLRNNVIYNWGGSSAYGGENGAPVNLVNCYYKSGPSTGSHKNRIFLVSAKAEGDNTGTNSLNRPGWGTDLYVSGNYVEGYSDVTADNTKGVEFDSTAKKYGLWTDANITEDEKTVHNRYINDYPIETQTAQEAYEAVLAGAGASVVRDAVDERIINDVKNGTGALINSPSDVGSYPELSGTKSKDSDNDGIPNEWEDMHGLNKLDASDALIIADSGYTYLEEYANALADGSYVRNVDYDPDVEDYVPSDDDEEEPEATRKPATEVVSEWVASVGDEEKAAGSELMSGLTNVIQLSRTMSDKVTFEDGSVYDFAITSKSDNGSWKNGQATGSALRYEAQKDGIFTLYAYSVSGTKTFYAVPEGASDATKEYVFSKDCVGTSVPIVCTLNVKKGDVYYFYLAGSKARFCAAKLEINAEPYVISNINAAADKTEFTVKSNWDYTSTAAVAYYKDDRFMGVRFAELSQQKGETKTYTVDIGGTDDEKLAIYVWESENNMIPVMKKTEN